MAADFPGRLVAFWSHEYSSKVQQRPRYSALSSRVRHTQRASTALSESHAVTLQARGYGFESRWLHP